MKITFIGLGNMATAMVGGIIKAGLVEKEDICGFDISEAARKQAKATFGIGLGTDNKNAIDGADVVILAIKPQVAAAVLAEIKDSLAPDAIIVSIMAGKSIAWIAEQLRGANASPTQPKIVRAMPNLPALVGEGMSGVCRSAAVSDVEMDKALRLLESFGRAEEIPETLIDAVIGVSGSAPAYVFIFIEALADAGVAAGMMREQAYRFASQAIIGSARMLQEGTGHPGELKDMVCSPGGTTIEAVKVLEEKGFRSAVIAAALAAVEKSKLL